MVKNFVDDVIDDINAGKFVVDGSVVKSSNTFHESQYIFPQNEWSLYYYRPFLCVKMSLWRGGNIELDLTREESKRLHKSYKYALSKDKKFKQETKDVAKHAR